MLTPAMRAQRAAKRGRGARLAFEPLEPRQMLDVGPLLINEFMAVNNSTQAIGNDFPDWIEIYNPSASAVDLQGWHLTDRADNLAKWELPAGALDPGEYLLVAASGDTAQGAQHANFKLDGDGEYLALVKPDGTIAHEYSPEFPDQLPDVSFGVGDTGPTWTTLVTAGAPVGYRVPEAGEDSLTWIHDDAGFVDAITSGTAGMVISEVGVGDTDWIEIQNVARGQLATAGWFVAVNDASAGDVNAVNPTVWNLPSSVESRQVLYRSDDAADHYFGAEVDWDTDRGWAMIVDDTGNVADFLVWGYGPSEIAALSVSVGGFANLTAGEQWIGAAAPSSAADKRTALVVSDQPPDGRDAPLLAQLDALGFTVDTSGMSAAFRDVYEPFDNGANEAALESADLIVITRNTNSRYHGETRQQWNELGTPILLMNSFIARGGDSDKWGWTTGDALTAASAETTMQIVAGMEDHSLLTSLSDPVQLFDFSPLLQSPKPIFVPEPGTIRAETALLGTFDGSPYLVDVPAGLDLDDGGATHFGTSGERRVLLPDGGYDSGSYRFDSFRTPQFDTLFENIVRELAEIRSEPATVIERTGHYDVNLAGDFDWTYEASKGTENPYVAVPFGDATPNLTGLGFSQGQPALDALIHTDVAAAMQGVNASVWSRIEFAVEDMSGFDELLLRMKYDDGFVAYLNGIEIARRNAPDVLEATSAATDSRTDRQAAAYEDIDVTDHMLFALRPGSNVLAIHGLNAAADDGDLLLVPELIGISNLSDPQYMTAPTPGRQNVQGTLGWVEDTRFSVDRGLFTEAITVEITTDTKDAEIRYTLDGGVPTETRGIVYTGPIAVDTTTMLRALAHRPGYTSTNVDTQTYIFPEKVAQQTRPVGYPSSWSGAPAADYDVDPEVVNDPDYRDEFLEGLASIPSLSVVTPMENLFSSSGLYLNPGSKSLEKAVSAEWIYPDGSEGFQVDCGMKMQGGASRNTGKSPKHSMSLRFRNLYGEGRLDFPLFGDSADDRFNSLQLRAMYNNSWIHWDSGQRRRGSMIRDQWARDSLLEMGQEDAGAGTYAHLYLNGIYWGVYNVHERQEASHYAQYNGGDDEKLDALNSGNQIDGLPGSRSWSDLHNLVSSATGGGITLNEYEQIQQKLDVVNLADYMIVNHYGANSDWDGHNWRAAGGGPDDAPWKIYSWDAERILESVGANRTGVNNSNRPSALFNRLRGSEEFRLLVADRLHKHFFYDGAMTPATTAERWMRRADELDLAIIGESARWGDYRRDVHSSSNGPYEFYTKNDHWLPEQRRLIDTYFPSRTANVLQQYRNMSLYPSTAAPVYQVDAATQHGGEVGDGEVLSVTAASGTIYYTTDGSDPRLPGGAVAPEAIAVASGTTVPLGKSAVVKARAKNGSQWSALSDAQFFLGQPATAANLAISEIHYHPHDPQGAEGGNEDVDAEAFEFIELLNLSDERIDLTGVRFSGGVRFDFAEAGAVELGPQQTVVVASDLDAFESRYGDTVNVAGTYDGQLDNSGERLAMLSDRTGATIVDFRFNDGGGWPGRADGKGASLELVDPAGVPTAPAEDRLVFLQDDDNWQSSVGYGGTPGSGPAAAAGVVINEVLSHSEAPAVDAIELHNVTEQPIDLAGWFLSDEWGWASSDQNGDYKRYRIPAGVQIGPGEYLTLYEGHYEGGVLAFAENEFGGVGENGFALSSAHGDDVWLMEADAAGNLTRFADHVSFPPAAVGETFGRWPDATGRMAPMAEPTLDGPNTGPRIGSVVISEIMYHPPEGGNEFVELYNRTAEAVPLFDPTFPSHTWDFDGLRYRFPGTAQIPAFGAALVVSIEPAVFRGRYGVPAGVPIFGPYPGALDNSGETLRLLRPDEPVPGQSEFVPYLLVDKVDYGRDGDWPTQPDGGGESLQRSAADAWGDDPASWQHGPPTPGVVPWAPQAAVAGAYVFYNNSSFDGNNSEASAADDAAIATDKSPLGPRGVATKANYTNYSLGINGIMVDVAGATAAIGPDNFLFRTGTSNDPDAWADASPPADVAVRSGEGVDGSDRVTITWADYAIKSKWLEVTVVAAGLGLPADEVFYFGNAVAEAGNSSGNAQVTTTDLLLARNNPRNFLTPATVDFAFDYNRDQRVNSTDVLLARNNQTNFLTALRLIDLSAGAAAPASTPAATAVDLLFTAYWP